MSILDRVAAAVLPAASDDDRLEARRKMEKLAHEEPLAAAILEHHRQIEACFAAAENAADRQMAHAAVRRLAVALTGHAMAEEAIVYPALAEYSGKTHAGMAYEEQAMTKVEMAKLQDLEPLSREWREKLEHIRSAVEQHVYQEENAWFAEMLHNAPLAKKTEVTMRYREEYDRYCGSPEAEGLPMEGGPSGAPPLRA